MTSTASGSYPACGHPVAYGEPFCPLCRPSEAEPEDGTPTRHFVVAGIAAGIAAAVTFGTFTLADPGDTFYVLWGPAIFAGWRLVQGGRSLLEEPARRTLKAVSAGAVALALTGLAVAALIYAVSNRGSGELDESLTSLKPGDCVEEPGSWEQVKKLQQVSCGAANAWEVTDTFQVPDRAEFPGMSALEEIAASRCPASTEGYLGPTEESWKAGDRDIVCLTR